MTRDVSWTKDYTPDQVSEIRSLVEVHKIPLIKAANMVAPPVRKKVRAPTMKELDKYLTRGAVK